MKRALLLCGILAVMLLSANCASPQPTRYETLEEKVEVTRAPQGTRPVRVALISFRDSTNQGFLVQPATAQLTSLMVRSGYFQVIEPSLVESVIKTQSDITPEKLAEVKEKFQAEYFLTGTLTNFEIRETSSGTCLLLGLLWSNQKKEYIVETGIDYRMVGLDSLPNPTIVSADSVANSRTDTSSSAGMLFSQTGSSVRVKQSSGGKLLRYALKDVVEKLIDDLAR
ncbi:MAG: hypothetical protein KDK39_11345 [Leptospiraceae bacterium]|nr:hypothetical protein [Leptospiraceae bacterium]